MEKVQFLYFTNYQMYIIMFWITNLISGLISPFLFLLKNKYAHNVAFVSAFSDLILMMIGGLYSETEFDALDINIFYFDLFILIITFLYGIYLYKINTKSSSL